MPTLYVNHATGDDSRTYATAQNSATPWDTIGRAAWGSTNRAAPSTSACAQAGDTVYIAAGSYDAAGVPAAATQVWYNPAVTGTVGNPITFEAVGTVNLTISSGEGPLIGADTRDYITWKGFSTDEATALSTPETGPAVLITTTGSRIEYCNFTGPGNKSLIGNYPAIFLATAQGCTISNNRITGFRGTGGNNHCGVMTYYSGNNIFEHNTIDNCGSGIFIKGMSHAGPPGAFTSGSNKIRYNLIYNIEESGILVHLSPATASNPLLVYQNIVYDSREAAKIFPLGNPLCVPCDPTYAWFANNTFENCTYGMWLQYALVDDATHKYWNNITKDVTYAIMTTAVIANFTEARFDPEHNLAFGYTSYGAIDVEGTDTYYTLPQWKTAFSSRDQDATATSNEDPLFVNEASHDYHLQGGSPALSGGTGISEIHGHTGATTRGAYITGTETIGIESGGAQSQAARGRFRRFRSRA